MFDAKDAYPLVNYSPIWITIGIILIGTVIGWYVTVFWITRKKPVRTVATLKPREMVIPDIAAIKKKYLALIDEIQQAEARGEISSRVAHQKLSIALRFFVYEAQGIKAYVFTLADLKQTRLTNLASVIEQYYMPEFQAVSHGSIPDASNQARQVVSTWSL